MRQLLHEIVSFFQRTDSFALALLLAFLVPFIGTLLRPRQFGQDRRKILERLREIRENAIVAIAMDNDGASIIQIIDRLDEESRVLLNPIDSVSNTAMIVFGVISIVAGLILVFYPSVAAYVPIHAGVCWMLFALTSIISLLYFYFEYRSWMEYQRLERKFGALKFASAPVVTNVPGARESP